MNFTRKRIAITNPGIESTVGIGRVIANALIENEDVSLVALSDYPLGINPLHFEEVHLSKLDFREGSIFSTFAKKCYEKYTYDALIPCGEFEILDTSRYQSIFEESGIALLVPDYESLIRVQKCNLEQLADALNVRIPETCLLTEFKNEENNYPIFLKGATNGVILVESGKELSNAVSRAMGMSWEPLLVQQMVSGTELSVAGIADKNCEIRSLVQIRKIGIDPQGNTWMGCTIFRHDIESIVYRFIEELSWIGPFEIEFIECDDSNQLILLEINPRLPAWCSGIGDVNLPHILTDLLFGHSIPLQLAQHGKTFCRTFHTESFPMPTFMNLISRGVNLRAES